MVVRNIFGYCHYSFEKDSLGSYVHIYNLFVYPRHRLKGKAKELLGVAIASIRETGYAGEIQIVANPVDKNINRDKLSNFYKSMGLSVYEFYA